MKRSWLPVGVVVVVTIVAGVRAEPPPPVGKPWIEMERGPFFSHAIDAAAPERQMTPKGIIVRLAPEAFVVFDPDLLRYSVAWTGKQCIDWQGVVLDGTHRTWPKVVGETVFGTQMSPGWGHDGDFEDPRTRYRSTDYKPEPEAWKNRAYGPLPRAWGQYKGLYLFEQRCVFSYTVDGVPVLDAPSAEGAWFARTLNVGWSEKELILNVMDWPDVAGTVNGATVTVGTRTAALVGAPPQVTWEYAAGGHARLRVPAAATPLKLKVLIGRGDAGAVVKASATPEDLSSLTHGGPARWPERLTTRGSLAPPGNNAYVVDTLVAPTVNPWHARMRFGGFDFFPDGHTAAICTWDGDVWLVRGIDDALANLTWQRIATGLHQPLGLKVAPDQNAVETVHVCCRDQIVRLRDLNGDGETDFYECFNNDHQVTQHFHEFAMGLETDSDGSFYYTKAARHALPAVVPQHGTVLKVSRDGTKTEIVCGGLRAANGFGLSSSGEMAVSDEEGYWLPANRINLVKPGGFYGNMWSYGGASRKPADGYDPPLCWLPVKVDRSPAEEFWVNSDRWGPLNGRMLHTSYGTGKLFLVSYETVDGVPQGGVTPIPGITFPTGSMRGRFNRVDGQLYVCGLVGWSSNTAEPGGFYRVRYTGKPVHLPIGIEAHAKGITLRFTEPLDREAAQDVDRYAIQQWGYRWSQNYGSKHWSVADPAVEGHDDVTVTSARLSSDGKSVELEIPGLKPVMQMSIDVSLRAADGAPVKLQIHNTINRVAGR